MQGIPLAWGCKIERILESALRERREKNRAGFLELEGSRSSEKAVRDIGRRRLVLERFSIREAERVLEG